MSESEDWTAAPNYHVRHVTVGASHIPPGYHDEVKVILFNHSDKPLVIEAGDVIARLVIEGLDHRQVELVDRLPPFDPSRFGGRWYAAWLSRHRRLANSKSQYPKVDSAAPLSRLVDTSDEEELPLPDASMLYHTQGYFPIRRKIKFKRWKCTACRCHARSDHPVHLRKPGLC